MSSNRQLDLHKVRSLPSCKTSCSNLSVVSRAELCRGPSLWHTKIQVTTHPAIVGPLYSHIHYPAASCETATSIHSNLLHVRAYAKADSSTHAECHVVVVPRQLKFANHFRVRAFAEAKVQWCEPPANDSRNQCRGRGTGQQRRPTEAVRNLSLRHRRGLVV